MQQKMVLLGEWTNAVGMAAGATWRPTAAAGNAELDAEEVAEVVAFEVFSPITAAGVEEDLDVIYPILDGKNADNYVWMPGVNSRLFFPPLSRISIGPNRPVLQLGIGITEAAKYPRPELVNTTLKYRRQLQIEARAGAAAITANFTIRAWGFKYKAEWIEKNVGTFGGPFFIYDRDRGRQIEIPYPTLRTDFEHWNQLPGGLDQGVPKIFPFLRYAQQVAATTANTPYQLRFGVGNVGADNQDMYFPYNIENNLLILKRFGVRTAANMLSAWIEVPGDEVTREYPKGRWPARALNNSMLHFGNQFPELPAGPWYLPLPNAMGKDLIIYRDIAYAAIQDNGAVVAANAVFAGMYGTMIEMGGTLQ